MDRVTIYPGAIPLETDLLSTNKNVMVALSKLSAAMLGTGTIANGFAVTPTGPASLQVVAAPGEIYSLQNVDGTAYSSLAADTTHQIVKQGILLDSSTLSCPAPGTTGQSINYLIEVTYQDLDANPVVLPYYNASNPSQAYSGPANSGVAQNTSRRGTAVIQVKAGASATTGSQVTPGPDAGYIGLYVVTVAFGQTTITAGSIVQYPGAPLLQSGLLQTVQNSLAISANDVGTVNAYAANFTPAITALTDKMVVYVKIANSNTGSSTFSPNGLTAKPILGLTGQLLSGGEVSAGVAAILMYNSTIGSGSWILISGFGALQVGVATAAPHAVQLSQAQSMFSSLIGTSSNLKATIAAASAIVTVTADEIIVGTALGGQTYRLGNYSQALNLATTGAGGKDTGAVPSNGFMAIYAIYNPATFATSVLAVNATAGVAPPVYGGANMPAGYTASALLTVLPTNASSQFKACMVRNRTVWIVLIAFYSFSANITTQAINISAFIPANAIEIFGEIGASCTAAANLSTSITSDMTAGVGQQNVSTTVTSGGNMIGNFANIVVGTTQSTTISGATTAGTPTFNYYIGGYKI